MTVHRRGHARQVATTGTPTNCRKTSAISARVHAPDGRASTIVSDVWIWPRAARWRTGTPAAAALGVGGAFVAQRVELAR